MQLPPLPTTTITLRGVECRLTLCTEAEEILVSSKIQIPEASCPAERTQPAFQAQRMRMGSLQQCAMAGRAIGLPGPGDAPPPREGDKPDVWKAYAEHVSATLRPGEITEIRSASLNADPFAVAQGRIGGTTDGTPGN